VLAVASLIPGIDTFADMAAFGVDALRGDLATAVLDLVGAIPIVGEAADTARLARLGLDAADAAVDMARAVDKAGDVVDGVELAADGLQTARKTENVAENTAKITSIADNAESVAKKYNLSKNGYFGTKGKNTQVFKSDDPIKSSDEFYKKISKGGREVALNNGKGIQTVFPDGSRVVYRVITK